MTARWSRRFGAGAVAALVIGFAVPAEAEWGMCAQMQADFLALDRAASSVDSSGGNVGQLAQQLDSARSAARRAGCQRFFFFGPKPSRNCPAIMSKVDQLERAYADAGGGGGGGFFFGRQGAAFRRNELRDQLLAYGCAVPQSVSGSFRTLCVRSCDGYYFPISYATGRNRFKTDAAVCQSLYPPGEAALYVHHTTGEDATQAVSLSGEAYAKQTFAFAYRSTYDNACATLFRSGSGALIGFTKPPLPERVVAASLVTPVSLPRRGKLPKAPDAAALAEMPANLDPSVRAAEAKVEVHLSTEGIRTVGPAYYYAPSYLASTGGEPPKLAKPDVPDPPVVATDQPPVAASILPNPLDFFRKHKPAEAPEPPPEPDPEPAN
jgi:hypothetical protein